SVGSGCRDTPPLRLSSSKVSDRGPAPVVQRGDVRVPEWVLVVEDGSVELLAERRRPVVLDRVVHPERPKLRHGGLGHLRPAARVVRTLCRVAEDRLDARRVLLAPCGRQLRLYALAELLEWLAVGDGLVELIEDVLYDVELCDPGNPERSRASPRRDRTPLLVGQDRATEEPLQRLVEALDVGRNRPRHVTGPAAWPSCRRARRGSRLAPPHWSAFAGRVPGGSRRAWTGDRRSRKRRRPRRERPSGPARWRQRSARHRSPPERQRTPGPRRTRDSAWVRRRKRERRWGRWAHPAVA